MQQRLTAVAFDLDAASLSSLQDALPEWDVEIFTGTTAATLTDTWDPGAVDLLVVEASAEVTKTLALCRCLGRCGVVSRESEKDAGDILGPRGSLQTQAQRAHAPLLVLVSPGQEGLIESALAAGAHSCLMLPINAKEVASMLVHAHAGNQPGRHTDNLEGAQSEDRWRDDGGQG
jgi:CheY-like chemotaxis protein